jgi:hypothetical protein
MAAFLAHERRQPTPLSEPVTDPTAPAALPLSDVLGERVLALSGPRAGIRYPLRTRKGRVVGVAWSRLHGPSIAKDATYCRKTLHSGPDISSHSAYGAKIAGFLNVA